MLNMETVEVRVIGKTKRNPITKKRVRVKPSLWANMIIKRRKVTAKRVMTTTSKQEGRIGKEKVKTSGE